MRAAAAGGKQMPDAYIVAYCSPTLANLKTGSLFTVHDAKESVLRDVRVLNRRITRYGLRMVPLRIRENSTLLYLYRPDRLQKDLSQPQAAGILSRRGYPVSDSERCVADIARHLQSGEEFPHEIGLFLSYPPEDVLGFMTHPRTGVKAVGLWKVYSDRVSAEKTFRMYDRCTAVYRNAVSLGSTLEQLIVRG